jgi:choloylglycine hydrolase
VQGKDNVAVFEFIPWVLCKCASVSEVRQLLKNINLTNTPFNANLPVSQLHWLIADKDEAITVECVKDGLKIYNNPVGVLTNNPPFDKQLFNLNNYRHLSAKNPENTFGNLELDAYSRGMGGIGLPGDLSSQSRFVRAAFTKMNSVSEYNENASVSQFFHILGSVEQQRGCCDVNGKYEITIYSSCCNVTKGVYYYKTYDNHGIMAVDMYREELEGDGLVRYPVRSEGTVEFLN